MVASERRQRLTLKYFAFGFSFRQDRLAAVVGLDFAQLLARFDLFHHGRPVGPFPRHLPQFFQFLCDSWRRLAL